MERKEFIERCNTIFNNWCAEKFQSQVENLLNTGAIDLDSVEPNYRDCYPVVAAILQNVVDDCLNGSNSVVVRKKAKKEMNNYRKFI